MRKSEFRILDFGIWIVEPISKIVGRVQQQGTGRRKSAAYTIVCEHFEEVGNAAVEREMHF